MTYTSTESVFSRLLKNPLFPMNLILNTFLRLIFVRGRREKCLKDLEKSTSSGYNIDFGDKRNFKKIVISGYRKCHPNVRKNKQSGDAAEEEVPRQKTAGKDTDCPADVKFKL